MELTEAMRTTWTCRYYRPDPIPDDVLDRAFEAARFGPSGGNRQPLRWVVVRDPAARRQLRDLYLPHWKADLEQYLAGTMAAGHRDPLAGPVADADHFAEHYDEAPAILVACARHADMHPQCFDASGALNLVAGASVYPMVQNLLLALRDEGVATSLTTLLCEEEAAVSELLGLPGDVTAACHVVAGYPAGDFPRRLTRLPIQQLVFAERYGEGAQRV